jgi:hypothetical protein
MAEGYEWVEDLIDGMSESFDPSVKLQVQNLEDGDYEFVVADMALTKVESTGDPIVRWGLEVAAGPAPKGATVERTSFINSQVGLNILGSDLVILGGLDKDWRKSKVNLGKQITSAIGKVIGTRIKAKKNTTVSAKNGKTYHNLNLKSVVSETNGTEDQPF